MPRLIGLGGYAECGKDTIARLIGWRRLAFADELKRRYAASIGVTVEQVERRKKELRPVLVAVGVSARLFDPDFWLQFVEPIIIAEPTSSIIVTDVRYENEAAMIQRHGGTVVWIERDGVGPANDEEAYHGPRVIAMPGVSTVRNVEPDDAMREVLWLAGCER